MPELSQQRTVLFSDIVGSSKLYQKLGNQKAEAKIRFIIETLQACAVKFGGTVIKTIGDEIMCGFKNLHDASECASEMNVLCQDSNIELRTGISSGLLVERDGDLFGDVVNNAAFLTKTARAREILIDEMALDNDGIASSKKIELIAEMVIKGQHEACKIYRLNWELALNSSLGATMVNNVPSQNTQANKHMRLRYMENEFKIDASKPVFVVGREKSNVALTINHVKISRKHCTIELKQGRFILQDHSTNGTYVIQNSEDTTPVHREAFALLGQGKILLGQSKLAEASTLSYEIF